ncbi:MmcB family DNA repair protein [Candidatus Raskinella chloraquaticus]|uniref:Transcription elongation factor n=1 Tax=Candidatus Raskinella chloraquaticus TaxID=1951219 RepID=A0A1W9HW21_9HYPH|nr:MmcB family DNA repair protein [Hyphomicrobiales bacterium]OQW51640.1 MAG: hypothetical protein A4S15_10445 [Proteobacteria bacterium SG_bin8]OQW84115.1 MAG: hypothetical protein BVN31_04165 [Proteobacteria bacterium ST_bin15]
MEGLAGFDEPAASDPLLRDGRLSPQARRVLRGSGRLLRALGFSILSELPLSDGRRADIVALNGAGDIWIVEIKSSLADLRSDQKWPDYLAHCDRFFFAAPRELDMAVFPADPGYIAADEHGAAILREAGETRLSAARRKAVMLRFATIAAQRLHNLWDGGFAGIGEVERG